MFIILALNSECWSSLGSFLKIPFFRYHKELSEQNISYGDVDSKDRLRNNFSNQQGVHIQTHNNSNNL